MNHKNEIPPITPESLIKYKRMYSVGLVIFTGLAYYLVNARESTETGDSTLTTVFGGLGVMMFLVGVWFSNMARNQSINQAIMACAMFVAMTMISLPILLIGSIQNPLLTVGVASVSLLSIWLIVPSDGPRTPPKKQ